MAIEFKDNSVAVMEAINDAITSWLEEAAGEVESQTKRNSPVDTGQLKGSWTHVVDESAKEATIGSNLENAIWNEFGTGQYALNKNGRQGYWVYVKGSGGSSSKVGKSYTLAEAKKVMAILRKKGLEAYYTNGKKPQRSLHNAFESSKARLKTSLENILKGLD